MLNGAYDLAALGGSACALDIPKIYILNRGVVYRYFLAFFNIVKCIQAARRLKTRGWLARMVQILKGEDRAYPAMQRYGYPSLLVAILAFVFIVPDVQLAVERSYKLPLFYVFCREYTSASYITFSDVYLFHFVMLNHRKPFLPMPETDTYCDRTMH